MNPLHAAARSMAGVLVSPRLAATKQAVLGKVISGVIVPQRMRSMSFGASPAASIALRAAAVASVAVDSSLPAMRRSRMPVRCTIHSSLVSTIFDRSSLVSLRSGTLLPVPAIIAPKLGILGGWA